MTDEPHPIFRRRKKSILGRDWQPPSIQDKGGGEYCRRCNKRHGYNGYKKLLTQYEKRGEAWVILWLCPIDGRVVSEKYLGDVSSSEREDGGKS